MTTVTIVEQRNAVTVEEGVVHVTPVEQETAVTVALGGVTDHGALTGLADDDHPQYLAKAGGTMTGALTLAGAPSADLHAATKLYVDTEVAGAGSGASDVGDLTTDGLDAGDMLRVAAGGGLEARTPAEVLGDIGAAASGHDHDSAYVNVTGDTMTGALTIGAAATTLLDIATTATGSATLIDLSHNGNPGAGMHSVRLGRAFGNRSIEIGAYSSNPNYAIPQFAVYNNEASQYILMASGGKLGIGNISTLAATIEARYIAQGDYLVMNLLNTAGSTSVGYDQVFRVGREAGSRYLDFGVRSGANSIEPAFLIKREDAHTNSIYTLAILDFRSSGTPAAGFGAGLNFQLESSTTENQNAARIAAVWTEATHATRKADLVLSAYDTAEREGLRIRATGSAAAIGFLGATPVARPEVTGSAGGNAALASLLTALANLGLITDSST